MNIGLKIRNLRKSINLTQVEFSKRVGVGLRFIRELEQGKPTIRIDKLNLVLTFLGYHLEIIQGIESNHTYYTAYPVRFNKGLKRKIRERDNYTCRGCNKPKRDLKRPLVIHHIDYDKDNCEENNLISLCDKCHGKTHSNYAYWRDYYQRLLQETVK